MPRLPTAFEDDKARLIASLKPAAQPARAAAAEGSAPRAKAASRGRTAANSAARKTAATRLTAKRAS